MSASTKTVLALLRLVKTYVHKDSLRSFAADLRKIEGNRSVEETVKMLADVIEKDA